MAGVPWWHSRRRRAYARRGGSQPRGGGGGGVVVSNGSVSRESEVSQDPTNQTSAFTPRPKMNSSEGRQNRTCPWGAERLWHTPHTLGKRTPRHHVLPGCAILKVLDGRDGGVPEACCWGRGRRLDGGTWLAQLWSLQSRWVPGEEWLVPRCFSSSDCSNKVTMDCHDGPHLNRAEGCGAMVSRWDSNPSDPRAHA